MGRFRFVVPLLCTPLVAQPPDASFFEARIRPVLAAKCYGCHASALKAPMAGLSLDRKDGLAKVVVPGKPAESRLLHALGYTDPELQMPPTGKLPDGVIADFRAWIAAGAPDPRTDAAAAGQSPVPLKGMPIAEGRQWWAFQPVHEIAAPRVLEAGWAKTKIDDFVLSKLEANHLPPSPEADARTLVRRAYVDLLGYKPNYDEVEAFLQDRSQNAYENLIDRLLESPHYGEQWGRHWLDVARFAEDNPTSEATNPVYPYAWRYRDWVIVAINQDVPYDRFVKLQLAADRMPDTPRDDMRALGYLGAAPIYHKDQRLSAEVIGGFMTDDWDERVDAVSRGLLGLTVACARCHDHKFDPILTSDYYGLAGVFASTMRAERPMFDIDPKIETRYLWIQNRLFDLHYSANLLTNEASTVEDAAPRVAKWKAEIESLKAEAEGYEERYPKLVESLAKYWTFPAPRATGRPRLTSTEPFMNAVYDAAQYVDGTDPHYTFVNYRPGEARDLPILLHGNVATPGEITPRHFLTVLAKGDSLFQQGSGRRELADAIFSNAAPLAARVIVNRVWGWHFGKPLVATPSDFGTQGDKPTHPELLDDLAARFMAHGWSLKWLNREIMLSAVYRQSSQPRADGERADTLNALIWRMNPRRLDVESYRDTLLRTSGVLNDEMYGPSEEADDVRSIRRTVYSRASRSRLSNLLRLYDFPDPVQTSPGREETTSSLQQLFILNSAFMRRNAKALAKSVDDLPDVTATVTALYRKVLARDPGAAEMEMAKNYLGQGTVEQYAHILLSTNEEIFWP